MPSKSSSSKKVIVIVGGGAGGVVVARSLSKELDPARHELILINKLPYRILLPATLRMLVSDTGNLEERILVPYDKVFINGNGTFIEGEVTQVNPGQGKTDSGSVTLTDGKTVEYDVLVLATGAKWDGATAFPSRRDEMDGHISKTRAEFAKAKNVLLVGGGAVGIELAGEIKDMWPDKPVTIINRGKLLLNDTYPAKMRSGIQRQLESRGVKVILDDYIAELPEHIEGSVQLTTLKGKDITTDLVIRTWGNKPNTSFLPSSFLSSSSSSSGQVKVLPTLQVPSHPNIFAIGDMIDWREQKMAMKAQMGHAPVVAKNVMVYLKGQDVAKAGKKYKGSSEMIVLTNGRKSGMGWMGIMGGIHMGPFLASRLKSKDLMISMARGASGN